MARSVAVRRPLHLGCWTAWILVSIGLTGCGGGPAAGPDYKYPDKERLLSIVASMDSAAVEQKSFQGFFAEGSVPPEAERARYGRYRFSLESENISGDSADATVAVKDRSGNAVGQEKWTFQKMGDLWKLKSAPLPPAAK